MLTLLETEKAIKFIKDTFEKELAKKLNLVRVSAPLFVAKSSGLNDDLSGKEVPVSFNLSFVDSPIEIVHSLAKWKRQALKRYEIKAGEGLYTDMNAIRKDETLDAIHSLYVDQWDWEKVITSKQRTYNYLKKVVNDIYKAMLITEAKINNKFGNFENKLSDTITFVKSNDLVKKYPNLTSKQREYQAVKEYGSVFIYQIGWPLDDNKPHDMRAADYDDWNLNGDILVYNKTLDIAFELSSMGIRVDANSLVKQVKFKNEDKKLESPYSKAIMKNDLPLTIGGGIGQSRLCMFFLSKKHIGEVQCSLWEDEDKLIKKGLNIL